ncbi:MAG TPA: hypothetical protein PLV45_10600, partial [bacterium]|nr:hypothetical protein [bacterium]
PEFNPDWRIEALVCPVSGDIDLIAASNGRLVAYRASAGTWTPMDTPVRDGNRVYSMKTSPATGNILLGTDSGCYAFIPDLNTWQIRNHGLRNILVNKILIHPSNSMSMVMATEGNGIFVSRDGGNTWIASNPGLANLFVRDIARDPLDPARLYAAHLKGFARSDDDGVSWTQPWSQELQAERIVPLVQNNQTVLLLGHRDPDAPSLSTIYRSVDQGDTWTASTLPANPKNIREIIVDPVDPLTIFATGDSNNYWKSMDYGVSFDNWNPSGLSGGPTATIRLVIDPMNTQNMWACGRNSGVYRSVDGGDSFTSCAGTGGAIWPELAIDPTAPGRVFICSDEPIYNPPGMMVSVNGGESFTQVQEFPAGTALSSMNTDFNHDRIFVFDMTGNQYNFDPGAGVWLPQDNQYIQLPYTVTDYENDPFHPDTIYAATHGEGIWRSGDGGSTWQSIAMGMENYPYVFSLDTDARQPGRLLAGASQPGFMTHKVFQSIDAGAHWTPLGNLPVVTGEIVDIDILDESIGQNDIWIVTYGDGVFISMNSGSDWESRSIIPSPPGSYITSVTHSFYGSQEEPWIHVASHGGEGAFIYDPNNEVFMPNNTGLPRDVATGFIFIDRILADPASPGTLYAAISDGTLYKTDNNGALWYAERSETCPGWTVHRTGINQVRKRYTVPPYRQSDVVFIGDVIVHGSVTGGVACKAPGSGWQTLPPTCLLPESWAYNYSLGAISNEDIITILMGTTMVDSPNLLSEQFSIPIASPALKIPCKKFAAGGFYRTETGNAAH